MAQGKIRANKCDDIKVPVYSRLETATFESPYLDKVLGVSVHIW